MIDPSSSATGNQTLTLYDVPADLTNSLTVGGAAVAFTITAPGQNGTGSFTGTAAQQITVRVTSNTMGSVTVTLRTPDGTTLTSTTSNAASFNLTSQTLTVSGTHSITVDPLGTNIGSLNLQVTNP